MAGVDEESQELIYNIVSQPGLAYEGASVSYKQGLRGLLAGEADTLAVREIQYLQMRSEHAVRNNGYAKAAYDRYCTNLDAITVTWKDAKGKSHKQMQAMWDEFADNPNLDGYGSLKTTQSIWNGSQFKTGAAYTRMHIRRDGNKNKVPLKLQPIPALLHDIGYMGKSHNEITKYGITFEDTKPVTYYFRKGLYEQAWLESNINYPQVAIPANELLHMFIRESPGQWIGIPFLSSVLLPLYEIDELTDATIAKQKAAQAIAWIIENTNPLAMTPTGSPVTAKDSSENNKVVFKAQGGSTQYLNKGEKIHFYQSTDIGANLPVLIRSELHKIAAALGIPYYQLTGDTDGLDFSSIRALAIELRTRIEYIHYFFTIPLGLLPLALYFKDLAKLYNPKVANAIPDFQLPRYRGIDELKDIQADVLMVQNGMGTLEEVLEKRNSSYDKVMADREKIKEIGLTSLLDPTGAAMKQANNTQANTNSSSN